MKKEPIPDEQRNLVAIRTALKHIRDIQRGLRRAVEAQEASTESLLMTINQMLGEPTQPVPKRPKKVR